MPIKNMTDTINRSS